LLEVNYASAAVTKPENLFTERVTYPGAGGEMKPMWQGQKPKEIWQRGGDS
jgi:hypothetical protein